MTTCYSLVKVDRFQENDPFYIWHAMLLTMIDRFWAIVDAKAIAFAKDFNPIDNA